MILTCPDCGTRHQSGAGSRSDDVRCRVCGVSIGVAPTAGGEGDSFVLVAAEPGPFRQRLCDTLQQYGCQVKTTADGEQALEWVRKIRPQTVFANVFLRRMLGITLAERVRNASDCNNTRMILIGRPMGRQGGDGTVADLEALYGAAGYIEEDLDAATLSRRTAALLGRSEPEAAAPESPAVPPGASEPVEVEPEFDPGRTQVLPALGTTADPDPRIEAGVSDSGTTVPEEPHQETGRFEAETGSPGPETELAVAEPIGVDPERDPEDREVEMSAAEESFNFDPELDEPEEEEAVEEPVDPEITEEIRRLGRIAADDLFLYYPAEVATALQTDHVESTFRQDLAAGRHLVQSRFPDVSGAVDIFIHALLEKLRRTAIGA